MSDLQEDIVKILSDYSDEINEELEKIKEKVVDETIQELKETSPRGARQRYYKGWRKKRVGKGFVIYNATDGRLTHLLEYGHGLRNGGYVSAQPHMLTAERHAREKLEREVERIVGK